MATTEVVTRTGIIQCAQLRWAGSSGGGIGSAEVVSLGLTAGGLFVGTIAPGTLADSLPNVTTMVLAKGDTRYWVGAARSIIEMTARLREQHELEMRVRALEEQEPRAPR